MKALIRFNEESQVYELYWADEGMLAFTEDGVLNYYPEQKSFQDPTLLLSVEEWEALKEAMDD